MNLKKTFLSFMAAGAILASGMGGAMAQTDSTWGVVHVNAGGSFNVYFCDGGTGNMQGDFEFGTVELTSSSGAVSASKHLTVCYLDTQNQRGAFNSYLRADNFTNGNGGTISASNLSLGYVTHVNSGQWDKSDGIGTISGRKIAGGPAGVGVPRPGAEYGSNDFGQGDLRIAEGIVGIGTGSNHYQSVNDPVTGLPFLPDARSSQGSWHVLELELEVPQDTPAGRYWNTITVEVTPANP